MHRSIYLIGLNHRSAGVEVREKYALTNVEAFEQQLLHACGARECLALSTCNRVEILVIADDDPAMEERIVAYWAERCGGSAEVLSPHIYRHRGLEAVTHLFRVAASLDSLVMGEPQILGQLKDAYRVAVENGTARVIVNRMLHKAFSVAKRVRTETAVASSAVSISYAAVELARKIFGELDGKTAMLLGAGEMAELAATHLLNNGVEKLYIANRTLARGQELAERMRGVAVPFEQMYDTLPETDIVISSTGSPVTIIKARDMKGVMKKRRNRPMFFIDIAVPRDIDPDINRMDNIYLYDIDDLKDVVEENMASRRDEAQKAEDIVRLETDAFANWLNALNLQPTIVGLLERGEDVARRELAKTVKRLGDVDEKTYRALETLVCSVSQKVLHEPIVFLKRRAQEEGKSEQFIVMARRMFNLDCENVPAHAHLERRDGVPVDNASTCGGTGHSDDENEEQ